MARLAALAAGKVHALERVHTVLLWLTLALLVAEGLLVFEPAARAVRRQVRCLREAGELMTHEARHDALTGLPNRNALLAHLLAARGVQACVDNPGGAHASLADLARLKVQQIKLDPRILGGGGSPLGTRPLVAGALIEFAQGLGARVTASAVDQPEVLEMAEGLRVDAVEGFLWGQPTGLAEALAARYEVAPSGLPRLAA